MTHHLTKTFTKRARRTFRVKPICNIRNLYFSSSAMSSASASTTMECAVSAASPSSLIARVESDDDYFFSAVLVLYFTQKLKFDNTTATVLYHLFTAAIYFMCIFGALLSDSLLGKFRTIMYLSLVYAMGSVVVALGSVPTLNMPKM